MRKSTHDKYCMAILLLEGCGGMLGWEEAHDMSHMVVLCWLGALSHRGQGRGGACHDVLCS